MDKSETPDDFAGRSKHAENHANITIGPLPGSVPLNIIVAFLSGSLPAYFALLAFGYDGKRLQIPLICAGLAVAGLAYLLHWERDKRWMKAYLSHLDRTKLQP